MKLSLLIKNYLAVGLIGVTVGAVGYAQLGSSHELLGAADGSWLNDLNQIGEGKPKKKVAKKKKASPKGEVEVANQNFPIESPLTESPAALPKIEIDQQAINEIQEEVKKLQSEPLFDKANEQQCRQNHIVRDNTQAAIGEVRKAEIVASDLNGTPVNSCWVTILPKGCTEMVEFKSTPGIGDPVNNFCNAILAAGAVGADVIAIGARSGPLGVLGQQPVLHSFQVYPKGQFARDLDQARAR